MAARTTLARIGETARALRRAAGLSQEAVAARANLASETISRVEGGHVNLTIAALEAIAKALGVPLSALIEGLPGPATPKATPKLRRVIALLDGLADEDLADAYEILRRVLRVRSRRPARGRATRR